MKIQTYSKQLFISGITFIAAIAASASCPSTVKVAYDIYPPYQMTNLKQQPIGIDNEIIRAIFKKMNCKYTSYQRSWKGILADIQTGDATLTGSATLSKDRETYAYFSQEYIAPRLVLVFKKGHANRYKIQSLTDLAKFDHLKVGVVRGYKYNEMFQEAEKQKTFQSLLEESGSEEQVLRKIQADRINTGIFDEFVFHRVASTLNIRKEFEVHPFQIGTAPVHFLISKKAANEEFVTDFNSALMNLKKDGTLNRILKTFQE